MVKQISKKNCEAIIESMQKSCRCGWVYDIKLEKMEEWDARIIQKNIQIQCKTCLMKE